MEDMTSAINSILNDPEQMQKVMQMAGQLMGNGGGDAAGGSGENAGAPAMEAALSSLGNGGVDPQLAQLLSGAGAKLSGLLSGGGLGKLLGGSGGGLSGLLGGASPLGGLLGGGGGLSAMLGNAARSMSGSNDKKQLVEALKPYLSASRQAKLDRAMAFAKVMRVAGAAALLREGPK